MRAKESSDIQHYLTHPGITDTLLSPKLIPTYGDQSIQPSQCSLTGKTIKYIGKYRLYLSGFGDSRGLDFNTSAILDNLPLVQPV